jgi:hypothetical protein
VREPQIELKDATQLPALVPLTPHTPVSHLATRFRMANSGTLQKNLGKSVGVGPTPELKIFLKK